MMTLCPSVDCPSGQAPAPTHVPLGAVHSTVGGGSDRGRACDRDPGRGVRDGVHGSVRGLARVVAGVLAWSLLVTAGCATPPATARMTTLSGTDGDGRTKAEALLRAGERWARLGDSIRAEHYLLAALDRGARQDRVLPVLVAVCLRGARLRAALHHAEPYLRRRPRDAELRFLVAAIYLGLGRHAEARSELETVIRMRPLLPEPRYVLGSVLARRLAEPRSAATHFERYLELAPEGPHAPEVRSWLLEHTRSIVLPARPAPVLEGPTGNERDALRGRTEDPA